MGNLPTVRVVSGDSYAIINETDFDPKVHELFGALPKKVVEFREPSLTASDIDTMEKAAVVSFLRSRGENVDGRTSVTDLRARAIALIDTGD